MVKIPKKKSKEAQSFLSDVDCDKKFWMHNRPEINNMTELLDSLKNADKEVIKHHITKDNNDFSNWIEHVVGDKKLADNLRKIKTKKALIKILGSRINKLKNSVS